MTTSPDPEPGAAAAVDRSDAELIAATRSGDAVAYGLLYLRHQDAARRLARTLVREQSAVDDLVAEAFAKVLGTLRAGHGPDEAFRAYLLTSLRNLFYDQVRRDRRLEVTDDIGRYETGVPFTDTASEAEERGLAARAFRRLPERWQTVLWHTEIEGESPAEVAPLLGLTANGVSALAYRARERLKQMYLQEHIAGETDPDCRWAAERLGTRVRDGLSRRERRKVDDHLSDCARCTLLYTELGEINSGLRELIAPVIAGTTWSAYLGLDSATKAVAVAGTGVLAWFQHAWHGVVVWVKGLWLRIGPRNAALGGGAVAAVAAVVVGLLLASSSAPPPHPRAAGSPPANPPASQPPAGPPGAHPHPPAHHPSAQPTPHRPSPPAHQPRPTPSASQPPYRVTPPRLTTGTLTVGSTDATLPITISNPSGGTGGGTGTDPIGFGGAAPAPSAPAPYPTEHGTPRPLPGPPLPTVGGAPTPSYPGLPSLPPTLSPSERPSASPSPSASASPSPTGDLTVTITLPAPMTAGAAGSAGSGWRCTGGKTTITCRHALLRPGASSTLRPKVDVGSVAGFQPVRVTVAVPGQRVRERFPVVVAPRDMRTVYASSGPGALASAGNTLIRGTAEPGKGKGKGLLPIPLPIGKRQPCAINDTCVVVPYQGDGSTTGGTGHGYGDRTGGARSRARLSLPAGAHVAYARLTWAGRGSTGGLPAGVRLTDPSGTTHAVTGAGTALDGGRQYSADVTGIVAAGGAGSWTFDTDQIFTGTAVGGVYDGWSLQVAVTLPGGPTRNVAVFDGASQVGQQVVARLGVGTGGSAEVGYTLWDGDRRQGGQLGDDTLRVGSTGVGDVGHSASASAPETAAQPDWNTLGTDVATRTAAVGADGELTFSTGQDQFTLGALAVCGPAG